MSTHCRVCKWFAALAVCVWLSGTTAFAQVVNGNFSGGGAGWTVVTTADGTVTFTGGEAVAASANNNGGQKRSYAQQTVTIPDPGFLSYQLVNYTTTDTGRWDYPTIEIGGAFFWVNQTTGGLVPTENAGTNIDNADAPIGISGVTTLNAGTTTIGFGVTAIDSQLGRGTARWDNIDFQQLTNSPGAQTFDEDTTFAFSGANAFSVATNSGASTMTVTMTATNGNLSITAGTGLITGGANNSPTFTLTGSPVAINAALATMTYTPNLNYNGSAQISFNANGGGLIDTDIVPLTITPVPDFAISANKTASLAAASAAGDTINYTITVQNTGDTDFTGVVLTDVLSQGASNTTITLTGPTSDTGTAGAIDPGETWTFTGSHIVTQDQMNDGGNLVNDVTVETAELGPGSASASATTTIVQNPSLNIAKTATLVKAAGNTGADAEAGDTINYTYDVSNIGNQTLTNIDINDMHNATSPLDDPASESLTTDAAPLGNSTDATSNDGIWSSLAPGDAATFTTSYTVMQADVDLLN